MRTSLQSPDAVVAGPRVMPRRRPHRGIAGHGAQPSSRVLWSRRLVAVVLAAVVAVTALDGGGVPAAASGASPVDEVDGAGPLADGHDVAGPVAADAADEDPVGKVLLISVPGLTWTEVRDHDLPAIDALLDESALADMAPRGVSPRATPGAAYLTISAGSRATSDPVVDGQQLVLDEQAGGSSAGEIFQRRTGVEPDGSYVALAWPTLERVNARQPYDAELGLLADTLAEAGLGVEAIGNADGTDSVGMSYERQVGLAAATGNGVIPAGELDADLLARDTSRAFGQQLDIDQVVQRFEQAWQAPAERDGGLVVVEASDLARSMRYRNRVDQGRYDTLRAQALRDTDELVSRLLAEVDPERDAVLLLAPYNLPGDRDLVVSALRAPGQSVGYMRSASTQRSGFLTLVDVAPTVLDLLGVDRPVAMEGRPAETLASGDSLDRRVDRLISLNDASRFREQLLFPTTLAVVVVLGLVCAAAIVVLSRRTSAPVRRVVAFAALADISVLPMSYVARGFPLEDLGAGFYWVFLIVTAVATAGCAVAIAARVGRPRLAPVIVLSTALAVPCLDVMTGSNLSLSAAFGYSPTGNSRLYGISNYSFGMVAAAACLLATFIAAHWASRRGRGAAVALLVAVLVVIGVPTWGSDVGGIIAFTPAVLVFAGLVSGYVLRLGTVVAGFVVTVLAVGAFGFLDLQRPAGERAHLGRLFERIGDEGTQPLLSIMERKLVAGLGVTTSSFWVAAIPIGVAFIVFLYKYPTRPMARIDERVPTLHAGIVATVVAAALGSAANDSGPIIGGVALLVLAATLVWLAIDVVSRPEAARPVPAAGGTSETSATDPPPAEDDGDAVGRSSSPSPSPARAGADLR